MFYTTLLLAASATFSSFAAAQNSTNSGACCNVDINSINSTTKSTWCQAEIHTCPDICGGPSKVKSGGNTCDLNTLQFNCECADGTKPNMSDYQQSVPGLMCRQWFENCINNAPDDLQAQLVCKSVQCGNKTTKSAAASSASSSGGASATGGSGGASSTSGGAQSASSSAAATALAMAREYGTPVLAAGMMAAFGFAL